MCISAIHARMLTGLILCRSYANNHGYCEFMNTITLLCSEDIILPQSPPQTLTLKIVLSPHYVVLSLMAVLLLGKVYDKDVPFRGGPSIVTYLFSAL